MNNHDEELNRVRFVNDILTLVRYSSLADVLCDPLGREITNRFLRNNDRSVIYQNELNHIQNYQLCFEILEDHSLLSDPNNIENLKLMINSWQVRPSVEFSFLNDPIHMTSRDLIISEIGRLQSVILDQLTYLPGIRSFWFNLHSGSHRIKLILRAIYNLNQIRQAFRNINF